MAYGRRYRRRGSMFRRRRYGRYGRVKRYGYRYPRATRSRATKALRRTKGLYRRISSISRKLDFQKYYNYNSCTYNIRTQSVQDNVINSSAGVGPFSMAYQYGNNWISSTNIVPYFIKGAVSSDGTSFKPTPIISLAEGLKIGQNIDQNNFSVVKGGRFRVKNLYCRWTFRYMDRLEPINLYNEVSSNKPNLYQPGSIKIRLCVFTLYDQSNTNFMYKIGTTIGSNSLNLSPIGSDNSNAYFNSNSFNGQNIGIVGQTSFVPATNVLKGTGSTRLRKVYDRKFTLNKNRLEKTIKINLFKHAIMKFDIDSNPTISSSTANNFYVMQPFQKAFFCIMIDPAYVTAFNNDTTPKEIVTTLEGRIFVTNENLLIYYDT
ncbi:capsid protein [Dipodfec virus RodF1_112]|uniref:Capsid protein n=1 Tax=Dipodfec virus RodF1_112 TaxID=2929274 RepID=A0A976N2L5_9VIRU|nr:capsid protein [Dipodfec virus RodF1_112]